MKVRATLSRGADGELIVTNQSSEMVDYLTPEKRERRERISFKIIAYVAGNQLAWDSEVQGHYEIEKQRYLDNEA